jgi:2-methylcitrate dehydratase
VQLALMAVRGEMGYASALTAPKWGFQDVWLKGNQVKLSQPFGSYVMENVLFKISFPAEFHAQTAVEAAIQLHPHVKNRLNDIERITITTQEPAIRIIDKTGPLNNPADRDHCIQYMTAVPLIKGSLTADDYEDHAAADPRIDALRAKMATVEDPRYTREYLEPDKRSIANAVQVRFKDGSTTEKVAVEYPIGHRRRRAEGIPLLMEKFEANLRSRLPEKQVSAVLKATANPSRLASTPVDRFISLFAAD